MEDNANYEPFLEALSGAEKGDLQQPKLLRSVGVEFQKSQI